MIIILRPISQVACLELQLVLDKDRASSITQLASGSEYLVDLRDSINSNALDRREYYIGAYDKTRLVGLAVLVGSGELSMEIYKLYVDPEYRGQMIAKRLVDQVLELLVAHGFDELDVDVSGSGIEFWKKYQTEYKYSISGNRIFIWLNEPQSWVEESSMVWNSWTQKID